MILSRIPPDRAPGLRSIHRASDKSYKRNVNLWRVTPKPGVLSSSDDAPIFSRDLLGSTWSNRGRLSDDMLSTLMTLPGTRGMSELRDRAEALTKWKIALQRGTLPRLEDVQWPQEPFKTKFADALRNLEMPRFTRRYPAILDTLIKQMLNLVEDFETKLTEEEMKQHKRQQQQQKQKQNSMMQPSRQQQEKEDDEHQDQQSGDGGEDGEDGQEGQEGEAGGQGDDKEMPDLDEDMMEKMQDMMDDASMQGGKGGDKKLNIKLDQSEGMVDKREDQELSSKRIEKMTEDIVKGFEQQMSEVVSNLDAGEMAFDDLNAMLEGSEGFDMAAGVWKKSGWKELNDLRKILEECVELRDLVRQLGRGGGKGPLRRAPEQIHRPGAPPGVLRSPLQPEEVWGLTRSGDLSTMLPSEMALLAHGWPRKVREDGVVPAGSTAVPAGTRTPPSRHNNAPAASASRASGVSLESAEQAGSREGQALGADASSSHREAVGDSLGMEASVSSGEFDLQEYYLPGAHAARMLHRVRKAERMLMSYERTGWLDDQPSVVTSRMEIRPAAELGPIILCLDTSGSMSGAREIVAKALALECLRGALRQRRSCFLYAFSGPSDVQELELKADSDSLGKLLDFLSCSFSGGTDVDKPLELSLERLKTNEWSQADILMVTDGEIPRPGTEILNTIKAMHDDSGLEVHGLLVSRQISEAMKQLCTQIHVFKSWTAVGGKDHMYNGQLM
ncbi:hypothetical protein CEUSTIGMA_g2646.t1 [Chlamydomonas eustigma]|uniref:VWFA domain-containing protein n=1 Tax=Chlamydomonas eustigma TaxID=1157962 RepID=A0A250WX52_9CHLO|nr:hypothetical protein CEUSTIGMA_g2646.t1 [Chlamydomonas eustigma]|eukprot:GAX75202.1 hypothetical protein CEUSTIGMA_g2646.t1 [Chlamydomonas eustigma]